MFVVDVARFLVASKTRAAALIMMIASPFAATGVRSGSICNAVGRIIRQAQESRRKSHLAMESKRERCEPSSVWLPAWSIRPGCSGESRKSLPDSD